MAYAGANGRLRAAPQELLAAALTPLQRIAAICSNGVSGVWDRFVRLDSVMEENERLEKENAELRSQLVDLDRYKAENETFRHANNIREVAQYAILPSLCYCQMATVVNQSSLDALPDDLRETVDEVIRLCNIGVIGQDHVAGTEKSVRDAVQGDYVELVELPDDVVAELREIAITEIWEDLASKSERMARGIEIIKQQSRDYGRQVDY